MSCFWDGNLKALKKKTNYLQKHNIKSPNNFRAKQFAKYLQDNSVKTCDVLCNEQKLTREQIKENMEWIKSYNVQNVKQGYDCSTCDPFLLLISQLFRVNIEHDYDGTLIKYQNVNNDAETIYVSSNKKHFKISL